MKRIPLFLLIALILYGQARPVTIADLTGDGSAHQVSSTAIYARSLDLTALAANSAACRVGDSNITTTRGQPIAAGGSYHYQINQVPGFTSIDTRFDLSAVYYLCGSGDKLAVQYVP